MTEVARPAVSTLSQTDVVIEGVKNLILSGQLSAGSRLPVERDLAAELRVSRGSLREGVRALAILGVLETRQGDGTYVTSLDAGLLLSPLGFLAELPDPATSAHLLGVRRILEAESAARAALELTDDELAQLGAILDEMDELLSVGEDRLDLEHVINSDTAFHGAIAQASRNPALAALIENLAGRTSRTRMWRAISERGAVETAQLEHRAILSELAQHDPERARIRMEVHILAVEEFAASHPGDAPAAATGTPAQ
jgi:GntR family transcriptional regulator, transcriptional repressor for pyruvate dehydrogenase complex